MTGHLPPLFVGHGSPMTLLNRSPARTFLEQLGQDYERRHGRPRAILCASAHWETETPEVSGATQPKTIHDFGGFPDELFRLQYKAPGAPDLARRVAELVPGVRIDPGQGLDHGTWVPLLLMWPKADIPVAQLSIQSHLGPAHHLALGEYLAPLADEGVLVMGSGLLTHNLRALDWNGTGSEADFAWAREFEGWMSDRLVEDAVEDAVEDLVNYRSRAPHARMAHPRDEHLLPLYVAMGAGGATREAEPLHRSFDMGSLSMASWAFPPAP